MIQAHRRDRGHVRAVVILMGRSVTWTPPASGNAGLPRVTAQQKPLSERQCCDRLVPGQEPGPPSHLPQAAHVDGSLHAAPLIAKDIRVVVDVKRHRLDLHCRGSQPA